MRRTPTIGEAISAVETIQAFLEHLQMVFPTGATNRQMEPVVSSRVFPAGPAPDSWRDRILMILRDAGRPLLPKEITGFYRSRHWPVPENANLGNIIRSNVHLMKKDLLEEKDGAYAVRRTAS